MDTFHRTPPENYQTDGLITEADGQNDTISYYSILTVNDAYSDDAQYHTVNYKTSEKLLNQGSIRIDSVNAYSSVPKGVAQGIIRYGALSYNSDYFNPKTSIGVIDTTYNIFQFVNKWSDAAIAWNFPTASNYDFNLSPLLNDGKGFMTEQNLRSVGWWSKGPEDPEYLENSYSPTQMYYAYDGDNEQSSNIIFFPMNWGSIYIINVNNGPFNYYQGLNCNFGNSVAESVINNNGMSTPELVSSINQQGNLSWVMYSFQPDIYFEGGSGENLDALGGINPSFGSQNTIYPMFMYTAILEKEYDSNNLFYEGQSSSYGIKKLISSIGRIEIVNVTSIFPSNQPVTITNDVLLTNSPDNPQLSQLLTDTNDSTENGVYTDLPVYGIITSEIIGANPPQGSELPDINLNESTLPINICRAGHLPLDNTNTASIRVNNNTNQTLPINRRMPFLIGTKFAQNKGYDTYTPPLDSSFNDLFITNDNQNVLPYLHTPGSSYGVYRTLNYGSKCPGLNTLIEFSAAPFEVSIDPAEFCQNGFTQQIYKPFTPNIPVGIGFSQADYDGVYTDQNRGGLGIVSTYPTLDGNTTTTPVVAMPGTECHMCVAYRMPDTTGYYYLYGEGTINQIWQSFYPIQIVDAGAQGFNGIEWTVDTTSTLVSLPEGSSSVVKINENINQGDLFYSANPLTGATKDFVVDDTEFNYVYPYPWNGNNNYTPSSANQEQPGAFTTTIIGSDRQQLYNINPIKIYGGIWQFASYWNGILNNDPVTGYFNGSGLLDWHQQSSYESTYGSPYYFNFNYNPNISRTWNYEQMPNSYANGEMPNNIVGSFNATVSLMNLQTSTQYADNMATPGVVTFQYAEERLGEMSKWQNITLNSILSPRIFNNSVNAQKKNNKMAISQSIQIMNDSGNEYLLSEIDTFSSPFSFNLYTNDLPFTAKGFTNKYWYNGAPAFRGEDSGFMIDLPNFSFINYSSHLWNTIQNNYVTRPKYLWSFNDTQVVPIDTVNKQTLVPNNNPGNSYQVNMVNNLSDCNIFPSYYSGLTNLPPLMRYFGTPLDDMTGYCGPYNNYYSYRKDDSGNPLYPEDFMAYSYSGGTPPGFNPQFIHGNVMYMQPESSNSAAYDLSGNFMDDLMSVSQAQPIVGAGNSIDTYNTILVSNYASNYASNSSTQALPSAKGQFTFVDPVMTSHYWYGGAIGEDTFDIGLTGFSSISSGNSTLMQNQEFITGELKYLPKINGKFINGYQSINIDDIISTGTPTASNANVDPSSMPSLGVDNSYYGLTFETYSFSASRNYYYYYNRLGPVLQYSQIMKTVSTIDASIQESAYNTYVSNLTNYNKITNNLYSAHEKHIQSIAPVPVLDAFTQGAMDAFQIGMLCLMLT